MRLGRLVRVQRIRPLDELRMAVEFEDGTSKEIDLDHYLRGPMFEAIRRDARLFRSARVEGGALTWPNGADIDPDVLYYGLDPAWAAKEKLTQVREC